MKKHLILRHITFLTAIALLVSTLASCGLVVNLMPEKQKADTVLSLAEKNAKKANSYTLHAIVEYKDDNSGMSVSGDCTIKVSGEHKGDYRTETATVTHVVSRSPRLDETVSVTEGFQNGYMFMKTDKSALCSEISAEDYRAWQRSKQDYEDPLNGLFIGTVGDDNAKITCEKKDGTYIVTLSELTGEPLDSLVNASQINDLLPDEYSIKDATLTFTVSSQFKYEEMGLSFNVQSVKKRDTLPSLTVSAKVYNWNSTVIENLDFDNDYEKQEADLRILDKVSDLYEKLDKAQAGSFTIKAETKFSGLNITTQTSSETDQVTFSTGADGFTYHIDADISNGDYVISYKNGTRKIYNVKTPSDINSTPCTDAEARDYLTSLYNPFSYNKYHATKVSSRSDVFYGISLSGDALESMKASLISQGYTIKGTSVNMTVEVDDNGDISRIKYSISLTLEYQGAIYTMAITNTCIVNELTMGEETAGSEAGSESN